MRTREWRALQLLGEFGVASDAADVATPWLERALELARREGFAAAEAIGVYSLGVAHWILGDLARRRGARGPEQRPLPRARRLARADPVAGQHRGDPQATGPAGGPGCRVVFEDTLQPFVEISCDAAVSYVLANQAGIARARGDLARARALLDESAARFEESGDEPGKAAVLVRRAYLELAEGALPAARAALEEALELRRGQSDRRGLGLALAGLGLIDTTAGDYDGAERHLAEARDIFRRAGDRWGLASTLWRTADLAFARGALDDAEAALQEARAVLGATQRERWIANTLAGLGGGRTAPRRRGAGAMRCFVDARDRYAARDDAVGVADVDERLRGLAKDALSRRKGAPDTTTRTPDERKTQMSHDHHPGARGGNGSGAAGGRPRRDRHPRATTATPRRAGSGTASTTAADRHSSSAAPARPT